MNHLFRLVFVLIVLCCPSALAQSTQKPDKPDEVDQYVEAFIKKRSIPGLSLAVVRDGKLVKAAGYGLANLELDVPAKPETVYEIGSISKHFTAEAILLLAEDGKLKLDDSLSKYLSEAPDAWKGITLRQILAHTSGLKDWEAANALSYRREYTPEEFIKLMAPFPLDFTPGEKWAYSNTGYPLLGMVIERASGKPFEEFMTERIFKPLGMNATRFNHPSHIVPNHAGGYVDEGGVLRKGEPLRPQVIAPNGGMLTTVLDMAKWEQVFYTERLLKRASLEQMLAPVRLNSGANFNSGLGLFLDAFRGHRLILHNGSTVAGYSAVFYSYPDDKLTVIVLCNIDRGNAVNALATRVASFYGPKMTISALPEQPDPAPETSKQLLQMLSDISQDKESDLLSKEWARFIPPPTKAKIAVQLRDLNRFAFLETETLRQKFDRLGIAVTQIKRYKLQSGQRTIYYTFEVAEDGRVARLFFEEE